MFINVFKWNLIKLDIPPPHVFQQQGAEADAKEEVGLMYYTKVSFCTWLLVWMFLSDL